LRIGQVDGVLVRLPDNAAIKGSQGSFMTARLARRGEAGFPPMGARTASVHNIGDAWPPRSQRGRADAHSRTLNDDGSVDDHPSRLRIRPAPPHTTACSVCLVSVYRALLPNQGLQVAHHQVYVDKMEAPVLQDLAL